MKIHYNKLVRDRIPEIIAADTKTCAVEVMQDDVFQQALRTKLIEEAQEVSEAENDDLIKELADLYEVIDTLITTNNLDKQAILAQQMQRRNERGGFEDRIRLLWVEE